MRISKRQSGNLITINGQQVDIYTAKIVYKCEECHADLRYKGAGLVCTQNEQHRGFIHRKEVAKIQEQQAVNISGLEQFYKIEKGKVVIKQ